MADEGHLVVLEGLTRVLHQRTSFSRRVEEVGPALLLS